MKTAFTPLQQVAALAPPIAAPHPGQAGPTSQTHANFHQHRAGVLRPMSRPPPPQTQGAPRNRTAQQARSAAPPESGLLGMIANAEQDGAEDGDRGRDGADRDPLGRLARLGDQRTGQPAKLAPREPVATPAATALQALQASLKGGADVGGASVHEHGAALLEDLCLHGPGRVAESLAAMFTKAAANPALRRAGADPVQVWQAQRQVASIALALACVHAGAELHAVLQKAGLCAASGAHAQAPGERFGVALVHALRGGASDLSARLGVRDGVGKDGRHAAQLTAAELRKLPPHMWHSPDVCSRLLAGLDAAAAAGTPAGGREDRTERRLRAIEENRHA